MTSTFTPNLSLEIPAHGDYASTGWDTPMDNSLRSLDTSYGGQLNLAVTGGTVTLSIAQASNPVIQFTGTLTANQYVYFPPIAGRRIIIPNVNMNGFALWVLGSGDAIGVYFWIGFPSPHGIVVTSNRVYWDYGSLGVAILTDRPNGWAGNGWLPCDGRWVGMQQHDLLYDIIGATYGSSGAYPTGTFKLPDFRGTVRAMADQIGAIPGAGPFNQNMGNRGILNSWGLTAMGGEANHLLALAEIPYHDHTFSQNPHTHPDPGHQHGGVVIEGTSWYKVGVPGPELSDGYTSPSYTGLGSAYANIGFVGQGGGGAHNNIQPTTTVMTMVKW